MIIKTIYRHLLPENLRKKILSFPIITYLINPDVKLKRIIKKNRKKCIKYFSKNGTEEQKDLIPFLKKNDYIAIPYEWTKKYNTNNITVFRENGFPYVIRNGKKLFGKKTMTNDEWKEYYNSILIEQDDKSPHKYLLEGRIPNENSVFADIGAAEGFLALDLIEKVRFVYLFECQEEWIEALKKTFEPYKNKVEIVKKYVSNIDDSDNTIKLDSFFKDKEIDYLKADIEGFEEKMLQGASEIFKTKIKQCLLCCYHRTSAEQFFKTFLYENGFNEINTNKGIMIWIWGEYLLNEPFTPPYTRHGVLYAKK